MPTLSWPGKQPANTEPARIQLDSIMFPGGEGYPDAPLAGRLILGDNLRVMSALLSDHENQVDLIYIDPPFFTNRTFPARIGRGEDSRKPAEWSLAEGYGDSWADLDAYLEFLYQRLLVMYRLLSPTGSLYLHLDWHANSYARILLDEIFGSDRLLNEIIWTYHGPSPIRSAFNRKHDTILAYVKSDKYTFNADAIRQPYNPSTIQTFRASPKAGFGKVPDLERGKVPEDWWYFPVVARLHKERTGYPTQKPEALLERIILASSNPGDLVADFFCGAGTAAVAAARLGRTFLAVDSSFRAMHATRRRLCGLPAGPFSMERDTVSKVPAVAVPQVTAQREDDTIHLQGPADLDYWEVDPAWDGECFRSAAQAYRPNGSGVINRELKVKAGRNACVRLVTADGGQVQQALDV